MVWPATLLVFGALVSSTVGQAQYKPNNGPHVVPVILPGGFLADTKEVAAAKEYFLNALAKTAAEVKDESATDVYNTRTYQAPQPSYQQQTLSQYQAQPQPQYYAQSQPQNVPQYGQQAVYRNTPVREGQNYNDGEYREEPQYQYSGESLRLDLQVTPVILENGYIADTQEVNAAKVNHFAAVAKAQEAIALAQQRPQASGYSSPQYLTEYQIAVPAHSEHHG